MVWRWGGRIGQKIPCDIDEGSFNFDWFRSQMELFATFEGMSAPLLEFIQFVKMNSHRSHQKRGFGCRKNQEWWGWEWAWDSKLCSPLDPGDVGFLKYPPQKLITKSKDFPYGKRKIISPHWKETYSLTVTLTLGPTPIYLEQLEKKRLREEAKEEHIKTKNYFFTEKVPLAHWGHSHSLKVQHRNAEVYLGECDSLPFLLGFRIDTMVWFMSHFVAWVQTRERSVEKSTQIPPF